MLHFKIKQKLCFKTVIIFRKASNVAYFNPYQVSSFEGCGEVYYLNKLWILPGKVLQMLNNLKQFGVNLLSVFRVWKGHKNALMQFIHQTKKSDIL